VLADLLVLDLCEDDHCIARLSLACPPELELVAAGFRIGWPHGPCMEAEFLNFFKEPKNRFQGTNSAMAGRYDKPIPTRFLAPIDSLKISAQITYMT
jgi:hypothetical protein